MRKQVVHSVRMKAKLSKEIRMYMTLIGQQGGKAKGPRKARTSQQARKAALVRWNKAKPVKP
jgi:hypothetical protein